MKRTSLLFLILSLGFILRSYNLNFPSIGYHNMKENEYLSMAQEMQRTKDFISRRIYFYNAFDENPVMKLYPQPPLVSYQTIISWRALGENLWGPRLFNVLFGISSILVLYLVSFLLFNNINLSLLCAFLLAIMPLGVFFSRNLQPESPAFFFMLLGNLFYLKFICSFKKYNLLWGGLVFSIAWLYKFSFFIGVLPFVFCFPLKAIYKNKKEFFKYVLAFFLPYLVIYVSFLWLRYTGQWEFNYQETVSRIKLFDIFLLSYWRRYGQVIWWYVKGENYTIYFTLLALLGVVIAFIKRKGLLNRYIMAWVLSIVPYSMIFSDYINQHNYYQMPFLGLVCIASVYTISFISESIKKFFKKELLVYLIIFIVSLSTPSIYSAISRMYRTVYFGEDVAGESLKEFTSSNERLFLLTHCQGYGIARYAQRYAGWPISLEDFKEKEEKFKVRYICIYPALYMDILKKDNPLLFDYIQNNYRIKEIGLLKESNELIYFILEKGKGQQLGEPIQLSSDEIELREVYKILGGYIPFYTARVKN